MYCDQFLIPFLLANLESDLKVSLKVRLVLVGCLWALEEDPPPPRSVLGEILKIHCF